MAMSGHSSKVRSRHGRRDRRRSRLRRQDQRGGAGKGGGRQLVKPKRVAKAARLSPLTGGSKHWIFSYHQIGRDRLPLPHLFGKERGACVAALIAQITRPIRFHVPSILGASLATDNDPINAAPKPGSQVKWLKQWRDGQPMQAGGVHARGWGFAAAPQPYFRQSHLARPVTIPAAPNPAAASCECSAGVW